MNTTQETNISDKINFESMDKHIQNEITKLENWPKQMSHADFAATMEDYFEQKVAYEYLRKFFGAVSDFSDGENQWIFEFLNDTLHDCGSITDDDALYSIQSEVKYMNKCWGEHFELMFTSGIYDVCGSALSSTVNELDNPSQFIQTHSTVAEIERKIHQELKQGFATEESASEFWFKMFPSVLDYANLKPGDAVTQADLEHDLGYKRYRCTEVESLYSGLYTNGDLKVSASHTETSITINCDIGDESLVFLIRDGKVQSRTTVSGLGKTVDYVAISRES